MNSTNTKALLLSILLLLGIAPAANALSALPVSPLDAATDEFEVKFKQAMTIAAKDEMAKLIGRFPIASIVVIMDTCETISTRSNDQLEEYIAALNSAWKKHYDGSHFVDIQYEYFSLLEASLKRKRVGLRRVYEQTRTQYIENLNGAKDGPRFSLLGAEYERLALGFEVIGDWYFASECWIANGNCFHDGVRGRDKADLRKSCSGYKKGLDARDRIELKDKRYLEVQPIFRRLEKQGYFEEKPDPNAPGGTGGSAPDKEGQGTAISIPLSFEVIDNVHTFKRPNYHADDVFQVWTSLSLQGPGSSGPIPGIEGSPLFHRVGITDVRPDHAGDGPDNDEKIKLSGNIEPVVFKVGSGPEEREVALLTAIGGTTDQFQGMAVNLAAGDTFITVYIMGAGSVVGDLAGVPVRVIDDNMDGIYGSAPVRWGHTGVNDDVFQSDMDSIVIGTSKRALPWSEYQNIEGQWYRFESLNKGTELKAIPVEIETGKLKLKLKGVKADWAVMRGSGRYENSYFDLLQNGSKGVDVPVGYYELFMGRVSKGKKLQVAKALLLPGATTPGWEVSSDKSTTVELGAPFGFYFQYDTDEATVTVNGASLAISGKSGERYTRVWNCVPKPLVSFRKEDSKRGSKPEKMGLVQNNEELTEKGFRAGWFPLDLILDRSKVEGGIAVQLTEKKNKLFGKITSDWK